MMTTNVMTKQRPAFVSQADSILPLPPGDSQVEIGPSPQGSQTKNESFAGKTATGVVYYRPVGWIPGRP